MLLRRLRAGVKAVLMWEGWWWGGGIMAACVVSSIGKAAGSADPPQHGRHPSDLPSGPGYPASVDEVHTQIIRTCEKLISDRQSGCPPWTLKALVRNFG